MPADEKDICGVTPFSLPEDHPFTPICRSHDQIFISRENGFPTGSRKRADKALLSGMLGIAKRENKLGLKVQAYCYYALARVFGGIFWDK